MRPPALLVIGHGTRVSTGDIATRWARLVGDLERHGLLGGPGACDAVARVGADVLDRGCPQEQVGAQEQAGVRDQVGVRDQADAP